MRGFLGRPEVVTTGAFGFELDHLPEGPQVRVIEGTTDAAVALHDVGSGCALHLIRYDYDEDADATPPLDRLVLEVRLPFEPGAAQAFSPNGDLTVETEPVEGGVRLTLRRVPVYGIVQLPTPS
jgi:hypothetical protein